MISPDEIKKVKEAVEELLAKMTINDFAVEVKLSSAEKFESHIVGDVVDVNIANVSEPQFLIGKNGETLSELEHLLRIIVHKKLSKPLYLSVDVNEYKKKKVEYLKSLARDLADEVSLTKENKILPPMPAYQRRIIHVELASRSDIITESQGQGFERCVAISPR